MVATDPICWDPGGFGGVPIPLVPLIPNLCFVTYSIATMNKFMDNLIGIQREQLTEISHFTKSFST